MSLDIFDEVGALSVTYLVPSFYLLVLFALSIILLFPQLTESFAKYGKARSDSTVHSRPKLLNFALALGNLTISKSRFRFYYWFAFVWNSVLIVSSHLLSSKVFKFNLLSMLVQIQVMRRLYEVEMVQKLSTEAQMHVFHFILGLGHYFCLVIIANSLRIGLTTSLTDVVIGIISLGLFIWASFCQFKAHWLLASLRRHAKMEYVLPVGSFFATCSSPHYFFEIVIYISFLMLVKGRSLNLGLALLFVICNLTTTAYFTHAWYLRVFPDQREIILSRHPILVFRPTLFNRNKNA